MFTLKHLMWNRMAFLSLIFQIRPNSKVTVHHIFSRSFYEAYSQIHCGKNLFTVELAVYMCQRALWNERTNWLDARHWSIRIKPIHAYQSMFKLLSPGHHGRLHQVQHWGVCRKKSSLNHCFAALIFLSVCFRSCFWRLQQRVKVEM